MQSTIKAATSARAVGANAGKRRGGVLRCSDPDRGIDADFTAAWQSFMLQRVTQRAEAITAMEAFAQDARSSRSMLPTTQQICIEDTILDRQLICGQVSVCAEWPPFHVG